MTRLLLDTHTFLWWMEGGTRLSAQARTAIASPESMVYLSAGTAWEMSNKRAKGQLDAPTDVIGAMEMNGFRELPIRVEHAQAAGELPPHHADPFDRLFIAQARIEGLTVVTRDPAFSAYEVPLLLA